MDNKVKKVLVDLNIKPSKDLGKKLVITLFEHVLHSRSQIPFHFELFRKFIETKTSSSGDDAPKKQDWKTEKQLKLAEETYEKICALKEIIDVQFVPGVPIMVLLGSTIHTAKESYQILFPAVNELILPTFVNETTVVKMILLKIIETDELKSSDKQLLQATNVFVLFRQSKPIDGQSEFNELRNFKLPKSCKQFAIHFRDSSDFDIFEEDFQGMSLGEKLPVDCVETETEIWYQSKLFVKGFKDILVNNKSIWT